MARTQLDRAAVAEVASIKINTIDTYRERGLIPEPDGYIGRSPWWWSTTISRWMKTRRTARGNPSWVKGAANGRQPAAK